MAEHGHDNRQAHYYLCGRDHQDKEHRRLTTDIIEEAGEGDEGWSSPALSINSTHMNMIRTLRRMRRPVAPTPEQDGGQDQIPGAGSRSRDSPSPEARFSCSADESSLALGCWRRDSTTA